VIGGGIAGDGPLLTSYKLGNLGWMDDQRAPLSQRVGTSGDGGAASPAPSSRGLLYLLIAAAPVIGVFVAAIFLATMSHHQTIEGLRLNGRATYGSVEERHLSPGKHGDSYVIDYRYDAYVPAYKAVTTLQGEAGVSCGRYRQTRAGERLPVIYDAQRPLRSTLDFDGAFRSGMSKQAFQAWSASSLTGGPSCYPAL
jgi:hypothetical protein